MEHARNYTPDSARQAAAAILDRMRSLGLDMKLGQAYEAVAAAAGYRNWATMKSSIGHAPRQAPASREPQPGTSEAMAPAKGDLQAAMKAAAAFGFVPVVYIDVEAEAERIRGLADDGSGRTVSTETIRELAFEFAQDRAEDARMYGDFFDDWLWESYSAEVLLAGGKTPFPA